MLLPLFSLPGPGPVGGLAGAGPWARALADAGHSVWQVLPPGPTAGWAGSSPYSALSSFALDGVWLGGGREESVGAAAAGRVDWEAARRLAAARGRAAAEELLGEADLEAFRVEHGEWIEDWALYAVLRRELGVPWPSWPRELRDREREALAAARGASAREVEIEAALQLALAREWEGARAELSAAGVEWMGDLPFYPAHDSADVWARRELFRLAADGSAEVVAGCPPDAYSDTGQHWGNPVYDWESAAEGAQGWWLERLRRQLDLFDTVRLDHFRGLVATWRIPAGAAATEGCWVATPDGRWIAELRRTGKGRLVAEDLGVITEEVHRLRRRLGVPGTRVVQFGFGDDHEASEHLPERCPEDRVLCTSTHDSPPLAAWIEGLEGVERRRLERWLGGPLGVGEAVAEILERTYASAARLVVVTVQDVLALGSEARINRPGEPWGQWEWRLETGELERALARLSRLAAGSGRTGARPLGG